MRAARSITPTRPEWAMDPAINTSLQTANGWLTLPGSLKRPGGTPRFSLHFPLYFLSDLGATHLIAHETNAGYEPPTRNIIERTCAGVICLWTSARTGASTPFRPPRIPRGI